MTKKLKYLIIGILLFLPLKSKALSGTFGVYCNSKNLNVGSTTKCYISGKFSESLSGVHFSVTKSENLSVSNIQIQSPYQKNTTDGLNYGLTGSGSVNNNHNIAIFDVKANSESSASYVRVYNLEAVPSEGYDSYSQSPITINVNVTKPQPAEEPKTEPTTKPETPDINKVPVEKKETSTETKTETKKEETEKEDNKKTEEDKKKEEEEKKKKEAEEKKKKEEEEKKKKEEEEKKKQEAEQNKQEVTTAKTLDTTETVGATETTNVKKPKSSNKSPSDILLFIATIVAVVLFVVVVGYAIYVKINEKNKKA